jgi:hypothetical protein
VCCLYGVSEGVKCVSNMRGRHKETAVNCLPSHKETVTCDYAFSCDAYSDWPQVGTTSIRQTCQYQGFTLTIQTQRKLNLYYINC